MTAFDYRAGVFFAEDVALADIAARVGTPVYVYAATRLRENYRSFAGALAALDPLVAFAVKANPNLSVLRLLAAEGAGADIVSGGELLRARRAGIPASKIVFSGVGKTEEEIALALEENILQFNVESEAEFEAIERAAAARGAPAPVAIRVNPDVVAGGHAKISTGKAQDKFGVSLERAAALARRAAASKSVAFKGLAVHIGSQIMEAAPFEAAFARVVALGAALRAEGIAVERLDLGGGLGVAYRPDETALALADYARLVGAVAAPFGARLIVEPGRRLVADAGALLARVILVKKGEARDFLVLDAGMNDLLRPALYDAFHEIAPVTRRGGVRRAYDVVGPVCESSDRFAEARPMEELSAGDLVAIGNAGAYGAALSSHYNARPLVPEVLVEGAGYRVIRRRPDFAQTTALED